MIGNKIKELRKSHKFTLEELADNLNKKYPDTINFNKGKISKWENNKEEPRLSSVKILADFFNVSLDYFNNEENGQPQILNIYNQLEDSRQEKVLDFAQVQLEEQKSSRVTSIFDKFKDDEDYIIDYVEGLVAAGRGTFQEDNLHMEVKLRAKDVPDKYDTIAKVAGDSMEPLIEDNDLLFIKVTSQVDINDIGIFQVNGKNFVKKLKRDYNGAWYLQSLNNSYEEIYLTEDDDIRTIGEVVEIYKN
ncbi:helix-turn-helix domain-containing protein [Streptococcus pseudoporcinus]|uniref:Repressor (Phage associated) n=1 Tax=Streptococcus pseudoporcinus TaxID=361101 RepID=A0A4U9XKQ2_9STRE|nr:XRE family transcriptional regulator [Streptococcus pseudoporcinus]QBX28212.1 CI-like repressor [Streptococcus phage Javan444]VTS13148.1 repressor (phage associated) [Streptococcus pseudoporcinus]VUC64677.1 repressor (phage associated) [Streptococcus pseudoporcinus]VUC66351.1 repressor (phage associated) [Streptococcus pseudoporcinus]VUC97279.1 repressor (phage associated) [Streptococcus pseudoporcinus]